MSEADLALIDSGRCIGCGECLAMCRFDAVKYNWGATYEDLQKKVVEHAMGICLAVSGKSSVSECFDQNIKGLRLHGAYL